MTEASTDPATAPAASAAPGALEGLDMGVAVGWAWDPGAPERRLLVELLCDGYPVAFDRAETFRPDLRTHGPADGCIGFQIAVPAAALRHGRRLTARIANTETALAGHVVLGAAQPARRARLAAEIRASGLSISGWVCPLDHRAGPVRLTASEDGAVLAETVADLPIRHAGEGTPDPLTRGFRLDLPLALADGQVHRVTLRDETGEEVRGSPVPVAAWPGGIAGLLAHVAAREGMSAHGGALLKALAEANDEGAMGRRASLAFSGYAAWARAFAPMPAAAVGPVTLVIHGEGDAAATRASLAEDGPVTVIESPDGRLDWPDGSSGGSSGGPVALIRAGDRLAPGALARLASAMEGADAAYSDGDQTAAGRTLPWCRPAWDRDLLSVQGYAFGLMMLAPGPGGGDLTDTVLERLATAARVVHVPEILHHATASAHGAAPVPPGWTPARVAARLQPGATLAPRPEAPHLWRLHLPRPEPAPRVAVLIPTRDRLDLLRTSVESLLGVTAYPALEVTILDNDSREPQTLAYFDDLRARGVRVLPCPGAFNFSALNNRGARASDADLLCLLNNDVEILEPGWLDEMVAVLMRPGTGAVGAKLLWPEGIVQHGGVVVGIEGVADHVGTRWAGEDPGYMGANLTLRRWSAVTAACLLVRRGDYLALGGMDETALPVTFNDVDLCLKLDAAGKAVVWTPEARLLHFESASRGRDLLPAKAARAKREMEALRERWGPRLLHDPWYNANLNLDGAPFEGLALVPRRPWPGGPGGPGGGDQA